MSNKKEEGTYLANGSVIITLKFSPQQVKVLSRARKIISDEFGRTLNDKETVEYLIERGHENYIDSPRRQLSEEIDKKFGVLDAMEDPEEFSKYEDWIFEMFQVYKVHSKHIELKHLFEDEIFSPVVFDKEIHSLLSKDDTFLMQLGFKGGAWQVIYMSQPYD